MHADLLFTDFDTFVAGKLANWHHKMSGFIPARYCPDGTKLWFLHLGNLIADQGVRLPSQVRPVLMPSYSVRSGWSGDFDCIQVSQESGAEGFSLIKLGTAAQIQRLFEERYPPWRP